ncbi:hypothetical protein [Burkholderia diffusa]|uniref:hypothetical protein n=1 Tax=Burkholderia diffusa TaxID=488732 RepID=UPI000AC8B7C8|nr:hypothetical protein [Burkholderia diffusa]
MTTEIESFGGNSNAAQGTLDAGYLAENLESLRNSAKFSLIMERQQTTFNSIIHSKINAIKSLVDVVKDGVQRGGYN